MIDRKAEFIKNSKLKYGDQHDYSQVEYINCKTEVIIICKEHGEFLQPPKNHLAVTGCRQCQLKQQLKRALKKFTEKANIKHNNFYAYDKTDYIHGDKKVIIACPIHGDFEQTPNNHIRGKRCYKCGKIVGIKAITKTTEHFVKEVTEIHNGVYDYTKVNYINSATKVIIGCSIHGDFEQTPQHHLKKQGCPKCGKESHRTRTDFIKKAKGRICTFYTIKCFNENEEFYKIGITMRSTKERYPSTMDMPYNYEIISEVFGDAGSIWDMEVIEKRKLKEFNYQPEIKFCGSKTECFIQYKVT